MTPIRVTVAASRGSAPREAGAAMLVWPDRTEGSIGGGALEWEATRIAREMLETGRPQAARTLPLGPALGQCCGGAVRLEFLAAERLPEPPSTPLWIWGAGHVGRALVHTIAPLNAFGITWIDTAPERFPQDIPASVHRLVAADPPRLMPHAPQDARHLIVTYSHEIDLALCHAALVHGFAACGLVGSDTKWARFRARLGRLGHADARILRIDCPIGMRALGKHPQAIAIGVAARLLEWQMPKESAQSDACEGT